MNNRFAHEFNAFASHLNETLLTPQLCIKACFSMGYAMAAIEQGDKCFCKSTTNVYSVSASDISCQTIACKGSPNLACGSKDNLLVYKVNPSLSELRVNHETLTISDVLSARAISTNIEGVLVYSEIKARIGFNGSAESLVLSENGELNDSGKIIGANGSYELSYKVTRLGRKSLVLSFHSSQFDPNSESIALLTPAGFELVQDFELEYPTAVAANKFAEYDIKLSDGSSLNVSIDYGDGAGVDTFEPIGKENASSAEFLCFK